ncbi:MAG TPA: acyl-CoA dehydrogenase family protein [Thermoplasmata archaeon]|nr:acyl-CoA dehydrogenase family protein [Thermoplasmata archaeon]HTW56387.1 acyl-CoA dehydrogenase family protein [Thermoplasmata archaeon]
MVERPPLPHDPIVLEARALAERLGLADRARELDRAPQFPRAEFAAMGRANFLGLRTPVRLGGRGLSLPTTGIALYHLGYLAGTAFAKLALQPEFASVLGEHGSEELVREWFVPMTRGETLVGNQITEPGAGSDAAAIALTARPDGDDYVLTGEKSEAAFAVDAAAAIVYGRVPSADPRGGITAFLVPQDLPGIERRLGEPDLGERWQRRGSVSYAGVRVPARYRIGDEGAGFGYVQRELTREHALLAAIYLGVARASWDETVGFVEERRAFGKPLAAQEAVAFPLVEDLARLEAAWLFVERTLVRLEHGVPSDGDAALAKWMATDVALATLDHAIQFHGGRGYSSAFPHEQRWRDVRSGRIAHGPSEIMLHVAARRLWPRPPRT